GAASGLQASGGQAFVVAPPDRCLHRGRQDGWCNPAAGRPPTQESAQVDRAEKKAAIATLHGVFKATNVVVVAHYSGLTVAQMQQLRRQMRHAGASVKVAKNRLAKIALEGTDIASIGPLLKGPTLIATSSDPVAAPKAAIDFAK